MSWWRRLLGGAGERGADEPRVPRPHPGEPHVFECRACGKVFDARRPHPVCPECDSPNVELMSG